MPASSELTVLLPPGVDLHARPAADFVRTAMTFRSAITVAAPGGKDVNAKSLLSVLALGAKAGSSLVLRADGPDGDQAVAALAGCVAGLREAA